MGQQLSPRLLFLSLVLLYGVHCGVCGPQELEDNEVIQRFRDYVRIPTVHPDPNYAPAIEFLEGQAREIGLHATVVEYAPKKPIIYMTWLGSEPNLSSILLSSHMDVVPVDIEKWKFDPFAAIIDENGDIYGRGTQDMKDDGMFYLESVRILKKNGFQPVRSIHIVFVPDEEIGGVDGWGAFIESAEFLSLNVGIAIDEGPISADNVTFWATWAEKAPWWLVIQSNGVAGHGSQLYDGSALENLFKSIESITRFREAQFNLVKAGANLGEVVSVNGVFLNAGTPTSTGFTMNTQPGVAAAGFDIRVPPYADVAVALDRRIADEWAPSARNLTYWFEQKFETEDGEPVVTKIGDSNPWWVILEKTSRKFGGTLVPDICTASTDMRFLREKGVAAFGFTALQNTPTLIHQDNEHVNGWDFLHALDVFVDMLQEFSSFSETVILENSQGLKKEM